MKKIMLLLVMFFTLFATVSCGKEKIPKEIQVAGREQEFFNINVYYKENKVSWGDGIQQVWVVEISPKSSEYVFKAYSDEVAIFGTNLNAAGMNTIVGYVYDMLYGNSGGYPAGCGF